MLMTMRTIALLIMVLREALIGTHEEHRTIAGERSSFTTLCHMQSVHHHSNPTMKNYYSLPLAVRNVALAIPSTGPASSE